MSNWLTNHIRCWASDEREPLGAHPRGTNGVACVPAVIVEDPRGEAPHGGGLEQGAHRQRRCRVRRSTRATTRVAIRELPPRSKKLSSTDTRSRPRTSAKMSARISFEVRGRWPVVTAGGGQVRDGQRPVSSLPRRGSAGSRRAPPRPPAPCRAGRRVGDMRADRGGVDCRCRSRGARRRSSRCRRTGAVVSGGRLREHHVVVAGAGRRRSRRVRCGSRGS